jgi:hypothetical protein
MRKRDAKVMLAAGLMLLAAGAAIGNSVGGKTGAIVGGAAGGAVGGAVSTQGKDRAGAAIGGAVGGGTGAAVGHYVGGSTGAVVGAGVGGAAGAVVGKNVSSSNPGGAGDSRTRVVYEDGKRNGRDVDYDDCKVKVKSKKEHRWKAEHPGKGHGLYKVKCAD